jgi:nicotinamidase-related amidase
MMLSKENAVLTVIDVQGKLAQLMHNRDALFKNLQILVQGAKILGVPILWLEQNPTGLGPTIPELATLLSDQKPIAKMSFSCCGNQEFVSRLTDLGKKQVLLTGIEAHICVCQTAIQLIQSGYEVTVVADGVSSRVAENREIGIRRMERAGAYVTCVETALFELLRVAEGPEFKQIVKLLK